MNKKVLYDSQETTRISFMFPAVRDFISVVIPVYNDPSGLSDTLQSLKQQKLSPSKYEVIVANDGAFESVSSVCETFGVKEVRISPNKGSYNARNRAMEKSRGEFIVFIDADITVSPEWLENGMRALERADYVGGPVHIDRTKIKTPAHYSEARSAFPFESYMKEKKFSGAGNLFVRRSVIEDVGGFDERLQSGGDKEFGKRVYETGKYRQHYEDGIAAIHPPRGYKKLINQRIRIAKGDKVLSVLYPDRFTFNRPSLLPYIINTVKPPWISNIRRGYSQNLPFSFFKYYLFCWRYKIEVNLKLFKTYYSRNSI